MKRNDCRPDISPARTGARRGVSPLRVLASVASIGLLLLLPPPLSIEQKLLAELARGEPITASPDTNALHNAAPALETKSTTTNKVAAAGEKSRAPEKAGFDKLSAFPFKTTDEMVMGMGDALSTSLEITGQIPASVKALNERQVSITGFMLPTKVQNGLASEFLLLKNQSMCCYGKMPNMNEWVTVRLPGAGIKPIMDRLVTVTGTLHVGELRENHFLIGIYRMDGEKVELLARP